MNGILDTLSQHHIALKIIAVNKHSYAIRIFWVRVSPRINTDAAYGKCTTQKFTQQLMEQIYFQLIYKIKEDFSSLWLGVPVALMLIITLLESILLLLQQHRKDCNSFDNIIRCLNNVIKYIKKSSYIPYSLMQDLFQCNFRLSKQQWTTLRRKFNITYFYNKSNFKEKMVYFWKLVMLVRQFMISSFTFITHRKANVFSRGYRLEGNQISVKNSTWICKLDMIVWIIKLEEGLLLRVTRVYNTIIRQLTVRFYYSFT